MGETPDSIKFDGEKPPKLNVDLPQVTFRRVWRKEQKNLNTQTKK
jgi:hypothetical protein